MHAAQPVSANVLSEEADGIHVQKDIGIRLGWDDEQILIWQNRQVLADPAAPGARIDAPLGVFTYRVDVREKGQPDWGSLVRIRNKKELTLAGQSVSPANTPLETGVQVFPVKINAGPSTDYWLPSYFTQWYGPSLVLPDTRAAELDESGALADPGSYSDAKIPAKPDQKGGLYEPLLPEDVELKYGNEYEFRVRLGDLSGGGPLVTDDELNDAPATSSSIVFRRYVAPKQLKVVPLAPQPESPTTTFYVGRLLRYFPPPSRLSGAALHGDGHQRRLSEAPRRQGVSPHRQGGQRDHQGTARSKLLRSRRRSHVRDCRSEDSAARQSRFAQPAGSLYSPVYDLPRFSPTIPRRPSTCNWNIATPTSSSSATRSISAT